MATWDAGTVALSAQRTNHSSESPHRAANVVFWMVVSNFVGRPKALCVAQDHQMSLGGRHWAPELCTGAQEPR